MNYLASLNKILNHPLNKNNRVSTLTRIFLWKINQLLFKQPAVINIVDGIKCVCYPYSSFGGLVVYTKLPEYPEMMMVYDLVYEKSIFIDIGASIGVYSLLAASKITKGKVFTFEPDKTATKNIYENLKINNLSDRVEVIEKVASDKNGTISFAFEKASEVNHISYDEKGKSVSSVTLDSFLKSRKISIVDIIKIDVEGAELKVLRGLKDYLDNGKVNIIVFEINKKCSYFGNSAKDITLFLIERNYKIYEFVGNKLKKLNINSLEERTTFNAIAIYRQASKDGKISKWLS